MFDINGSLPLNWKTVTPIIVCILILVAITSIVKIGKTKLLSMNEFSHITPPFFELFRPFIMVWLYLSLCFSLPGIAMAYTVPLMIFLAVVMIWYATTWKRCGYSIVSYIILNIAVIIISIITATVIKRLFSIIISYIGG